MISIPKVAMSGLFALAVFAFQAPAQASMAGIAGNAMQAASETVVGNGLTTEVGRKRHRRVRKHLRRHRNIHRHRHHRRNWRRRHGHYTRDHCVAREIWGLAPTRRCRLHYGIHIQL